MTSTLRQRPAPSFRPLQYPQSVPAGRTRFDVFEQARSAPALVSAEPARPTTETGKRSSQIKWKKLGAAALLFMGGMLLHQLPSRAKAGFSVLTPDWKVWTRVLLGIGAVQKINQGLDRKPPPWLSALETVAVIHPLSMGFARKNLGQLAVIAPLVAGMVEGASRVEKTGSKPLQERFGIPPLVTRLALMAAMMVAGIKLYPKIYKPLAQKGLFGGEARAEAVAGASGAMAAGMVTCARGCTPGGVVCMSEMGEIFGSLGHWFKSRFEPSA